MEQTENEADIVFQLRMAREDLAQAWDERDRLREALEEIAKSDASIADLKSDARAALRSVGAAV